ncbi:MAG TPA: hypothetical protein VEA18_00370 [Candidatus Kapabacteria bacterium]|nr:hypothetical protein [Candidatus Kapabacteria bacterium]
MCRKAAGSTWIAAGWLLAFMLPLTYGVSKTCGPSGQQLLAVVGAHRPFVAGIADAKVAMVHRDAA